MTSPNPKPDDRPDRPRTGVHGWLDRRRRTAHGRLVVRVVLTALGFAVVATGIALIPLPGPGWAIVIGGLAILALEYAWAHRLMTFTRRQVTAWVYWVAKRPLWLRFLIGAAGFVFVAAVLWVSLKTTADFDYLRWGRDRIGW